MRKIDADALEIKFEEECACECAICRYGIYENADFKGCELIKTAPTVEDSVKFEPVQIEPYEIKGVNMSNFYKPLTPQFRREINASIDARIAEMETCKQNVLVQNHICAYEKLKELIEALPDGFLMPLTD